MTRGEAIQKLIDVFDEYHEVADAIDVLAADPGFDPPGGCQHDDRESLLTVRLDYTGKQRVFCVTCLRWAGEPTQEEQPAPRHEQSRMFYASGLITREAMRVLEDRLRANPPFSGRIKEP